LGKRFLVTESKAIEFRADLFNLLNHPSRDNPVTDITAADFGKVVSFGSSRELFSLRSSSASNANVLGELGFEEAPVNGQEIEYPTCATQNQSRMSSTDWG
jgi:hypothetical protein